MKTFEIILLIFGLFEVVSNLYHLTRGSKTKIGESARKQHQELPLNIGVHHFYYKAILMLAVGILFLTSSLIYFSIGESKGELFTLYSSIFLCVYGFVQAVIYFRTIKVWASCIVYSLPLIFYFIVN
jgi:hypothetical protein